ncbi:Glycosyltransferase Family 47 protein [Gigaspora rosea]|uniref:Glycosyltransferase Family 47 protein n=1 Tax=Gigaspora rosea TaxID=44941 RepID=A0A397VEN9_9GLOM|nr:Glycosyltransferase Family 47 protein [Gigaspora rosea]
MELFATGQISMQIKTANINTYYIFYKLSSVLCAVSVSTLQPLPLVSSNVQWPSNLSVALCKPKIYVYKLPSHLKSQSHYGYEICTISSYNPDAIFYEQLVNPGKIRDLYVTSNPNDADFFFIPFFGSCYLMNCWNNNYWNYTKSCNLDNQYSLPLMNWIIQEHPYWNRTNGKDHIMILSMNEIPSYFTESQPLLLNASFLTVIGDRRANGIMEHRYRHMHDIVVPSTADILNLIKINPRKYFSEDGNKNARNVFAIFRGCCRNIGPEVDYSAGVISLFFNGLADSPRYDIDEAVDLKIDDYAWLLARAKFGLAPQGRALGIARLWEYLAFGVVPVIVSDGIVLPFENDVDWNSMAVFIRREDAHLIDEILLSITENEYQRKRQRVWEIGSHLIKNSWHYIVRDLCRKMDRIVPVELDI